jgi:hypothetical protein
VNALLHSLDIESDGRCWESQGASSELEELWNGIHAGGLEAVQSGQFLDHSNQWAAESSTQDLQHWVGEFRQQVDGWADQFDEVCFTCLLLSSMDIYMYLYLHHAYIDL